MKKIRLMFSAAAMFSGLAGAVATNVSYGAQEVKYDWMDWNNETIIANATQAEAQNLCSPSSAICLRARNNVFIHTTGYLPWQERSEQTKTPVSNSQDFAAGRGSR